MSEAEAAKKVEPNPTQSPPDFEPSAELVGRLAKLSKQQQTTMLRVVVAHLSSARGSIGALFRGTDKVCAKDVFYRKPNGWWHKASYRAALDLYVREYRPHYLKQARQSATEIIEAALTAAAEKMAELIDEMDPNVALRASKEVLAMGGVGAEVDRGERVTVIINDAEWRPN
jgi:hypothetical protein